MDDRKEFEKWLLRDQLLRMCDSELGGMGKYEDGKVVCEFSEAKTIEMSARIPHKGAEIGSGYLRVFRPVGGHVVVRPLSERFTIEGYGKFRVTANDLITVVAIKEKAHKLRFETTEDGLGTVEIYRE